MTLLNLAMAAERRRELLRVAEDRRRNAPARTVRTWRRTPPAVRSGADGAPVHEMEDWRPTECAAS